MRDSSYRQLPYNYITHPHNLPSAADDDVEHVFSIIKSFPGNEDLETIDQFVEKRKDEYSVCF